jgi:predicted nucleic acid-binding protein
VPAELVNPQAALVYAGLDRGEAEVLALALERQARLVIIDERKGRSFARRLHLPLAGSLGLLVAAKQKGLVKEVRPLVMALQTAGLYFHPAVIADVLQTVSE